MLKMVVSNTWESACKTKKCKLVDYKVGWFKFRRKAEEIFHVNMVFNFITKTFVKSFKFHLKFCSEIEKPY